MKNNKLKKIGHDEAVKMLKAWLNDRKLKFIDLEEKLIKSNKKRPDLLLTDNNLCIEVKTLNDSSEEIEKNLEIERKLIRGEVVTGWIDSNRNRASDDLSDCRKKFREFPQKRTAIIYFNFRKNKFSEFIVDDLLKGDESYKITAFDKNIVIDPSFKNRLGRSEKIKEIGAIINVTGTNSFDIYHLSSADKHRRVSKTIFATKNDKQFLFIDDYKKPEIQKI